MGKYYVVWCGRKTGVFRSWAECKAQIDEFPGAKYKSFNNFLDAEEAFDKGFQGWQPKVNATPEKCDDLGIRPIAESIAVDASCMGNPGKMEYRGVFVATGQEVFHSKVYPQGTNNIGEFLAIVHCLAWQKKNNLNYPIYSDSVNAQLWIKAKRCKSKLERTAVTAELFDVITRAELWLQNNDFRVPIFKWRTELWGEIPADFNRK